jgi:NAD-dependent DNA ligase
MNNFVSDYEKEFIPDKCPRCGGKLVWVGTDVCCENPECKGIDSHDLMVWCGSLGYVEDLGFARINEFLSRNNISTIEGIYSCTDFHLGNSITDKKLKKMVDKLTVLPIDTVSALCALNIPRLGRVSAGKLVKAKLVDNLISDSPDEIKITAAVGSATCKSILINKDKLRRLFFVKDRLIKDENNSNKVAQKGSIVLHGSFSIKRSDFEKLASEAGYPVIGNVKKATYLVTDFPDDNRASKVAAARANNIEIISEREFMKIIGR